MASLPEPFLGLVIRYSYLWLDEHRRGREEGTKDRPCAIVLTAAVEAERTVVTVVPVTHSPPRNPRAALELSSTTKRRLGLDDARSWIVLEEANRFVWPGPDLRPAISGDISTIAYGPLPYRIYETVRLKFLDNIKSKHATTVFRTE